jgi:hypothetical protein
MAIPEKTSAGLKKWAKSRKTATIEKALEGKPGVEDPKALAVWVRKQGLGEAEFKRHQRGKKR